MEAFNPEYMDSTTTVRENFVNMMKKNKAEVKEAHSHQMLFRQGRAAEFVFQTCQTLEITSQASFHTLEVYNRFTLGDLEKGRDFVCKSKSIFKLAHWDMVQAEMEKCQHLRVMSCCQLVCKFLSLSKAVTVSKLQAKLTQLERYYPESSILHSECDVLQTLGYSVKIQTPFDFIEILLEMLVRMFYPIKDTLAEVKLLSVDFLTLLYLRYENVSRRIVQRCPRLSDVKDAEVKIRADKLLAAVAIVDAAVQIRDPTHHSIVKDGLFYLTKIAPEDIARFKESLFLETKMYGEPLQHFFSHSPVQLVNQLLEQEGLPAPTPFKIVDFLGL